MKNIWPNVIIAGAPKCGTSSLFFWLTAHPQVCGSRVKETFYFFDRVHPRFNSNANFIEHGLTKYQQYFSHYTNEKIIVEATAPYIYQKTAIEQFSKFQVKPKIIFILREPAQRLYSLFTFDKYRMGYHPENLTFKQFIANQKEIKEHSQYKESLYINFINQWINAFGKDQILVYQFEKIKQNKVAFMKQIASDLQIDPNFYNQYGFFHRNETLKMKSHKLHRFGLAIQPYVPQWLQEKVIMPLYLKLNAEKIPQKNQDDLAFVNTLKADFEVVNQKLNESFPTIDLALWQ